VAILTLVLPGAKKEGGGTKPLLRREVAPKGKEERVPGDYIVVRPVRDHEEWTRLACDAEGGIFLAQGFVVRDETRGGYVTDPFEVEEALAVVAEDKGWALADVGGALVSGEGPSDTDAAGARMEGGWWCLPTTSKRLTIRTSNFVPITEAGR
jgi:hypothetical protein